MRPYRHAMSSAARFGGTWQDYLAVHEFIDSTKACCADARHRMILHSVDLGSALAKIAFPERLDTDLLIRQHVIEDLGCARTLAEWLERCRRPKLPRLHPDAVPVDVDRIIAEEIAAVGEAAGNWVRNVCALLTLPMTLAPDFGPESLCILANSFGPQLVRRLIGPPTEIGGICFDPALCAERIIFRLYRSIPPMTAVVYAQISS